MKLNSPLRHLLWVFFFLKNGQLCNTWVDRVTQCNITFYRCILLPACPNVAKCYTAATLLQNNPNTSNDPIGPNDLVASNEPICSSHPIVSNDPTTSNDLISHNDLTASNQPFDSVPVIQLSQMTQPPQMAQPASMTKYPQKDPNSANDPIGQQPQNNDHN